MFYLITFWEWILLSFCSKENRFDYANYVKRYNNLEYISLDKYTDNEVGYFVITKLFHTLGFEFDIVYKIFVLFILFAVVYVVKKYTKKICIPMILFLWYPAIMTAYNTREGIAMAIIIYAIAILLDNKKNAVIKYILCVAIATTIHTSAIFYIVFVIIRLQARLSKLQIVLIVVVGIVAMLGIDNISIIQALIGGRRFSYYFGRTHVSLDTIIFCIVWQMSICLMIAMLRSLREKRSLSFSLVKNNMTLQDNYFSDVEKIFLLLLILCPLYSYTFTYIRLARNILIFMYIYYARWSETPENGKKGFKHFSYNVWALLTFLGLNIMVQKDFEDVIYVFYTMNDFTEKVWSYSLGVLLFVILIVCGFIMDGLKYRMRKSK